MGDPILRGRARIDWSVLGTLPAPRRKLRDETDRERLMAARIKQKKRPKNHSTNRERSRADREKALRIKISADAAVAARRRYLAAVRAYWRGEAAEHPGGMRA